MNDKRIRESIDACRPGSDDLNAADLSFLAAELAKDARLRVAYDRVQKLDVKIAAAFQDVPVPEGLRERLLARLEEAASQAAPDAATAEPSLAQPPVTLPPPESRPRSTRRWWLSGVAALAASLLIAVLGWPWWFASESHSQEDVLAAAEELWNSEMANPDQWEAGGTPSSDYPLSASVRVPPSRRQAIRDFVGGRGMAYDLAGVGRARATLFVVRLSVHY
ncbi:MAG: hypothetical protein ACYC0Y_20365, partial [Pirellulales bacterium]